MAAGSLGAAATQFAECRVVQRSFKRHYSRSPCIASLLLLSPAPFQSLKMPFCKGVISISPHSFKMVLKTNSLWTQSYWLLSIPFQSALYYRSAAHWVPGLPGSFALPLFFCCWMYLAISSVTSFANLQIANEKIKRAQFATCSQSQRILSLFNSLFVWGVFLFSFKFWRVKRARWEGCERD